MNRAINYLTCKIFYGITCDEKIIYYAAVQQHCSTAAAVSGVPLIKKLSS